MRTRRLAASLLMSVTMLLSLVAVAPGASAQVPDVTSTTRSEPTAQVIAKWRDWCYTYETGWDQCPMTTLFGNIWP